MAPITTLREIIAHLSDYPLDEGDDVGPTIFAGQPWTPDSPAEVLYEDAVDGVSPSAPDLHYLLEVSLALEVLEDWSGGRPGATQSLEGAVEVILYYAAKDAYPPRTS